MSASWRANRAVMCGCVGRAPSPAVFEVGLVVWLLDLTRLGNGSRWRKVKVKIDRRVRPPYTALNFAPRTPQLYLEHLTESLVRVLNRGTQKKLAIRFPQREKICASMSH